MTRKRPGLAVKGILQALRMVRLDNPGPGGPEIEYLLDGPGGVLYAIELALQEAGYEQLAPKREGDLTPTEDQC